MAPVVKVSVVLLTETSFQSSEDTRGHGQCPLFSPTPSPPTKQEKLVSSSTPPQIFSHSLTTVILELAEGWCILFSRCLQLLHSWLKFYSLILVISY